MTQLDEFAVLHALKVKGLAPADQVADSLGVDETELLPLLQAGVDAETIRFREGRVTGYTLTAPGRERHAQLLPAAPAEISAAYDAFLEPNRAFKQVTTDWQLREEGADPAPILDRLGLVDSDVNHVIDVAVGGASRYETYRSRFADALARLRAGDDSAFARPMSGSYHDVWMELHEDLLASLGRERTEADE
jgi:hypothetical protein